MQATPEDARRSFTDAPLRRAWAEVYCFVLTFVFHDGNNDGRKAGTIVIVGVWAMIEVGAAFGYASLPDQFFFLRIVVGVLIGRMWGIEINNFAGVEFAYASDGGNDSEGDDGDE
jgi:hypothetical protein